jgi:hypothetical protein
LERYRNFGLITACCLALTQEQEAEERSIDLPTDDPEIVGYMLRFMYQRDYQLPSDDAPRPFWIRWKTRTKNLNAPAQEWLRAMETAVWSHSSEALEKLHEQRSDLIEAYYMASICHTQANTKQNCHNKVLDIFQRSNTGLLEIDGEILTAVKPLIDNAFDKASKSFRDGLRQPVSSEDCSIHAKVYSLADKYLVKGLKEAARDKFKSCMRESFAGRAFYDAVYIVFTTTPNRDAGLRDLVIQRVAHEKTRYCLAANPDLEDALEDMPDLVKRVLRYEVMLHHAQVLLQLKQKFGKRSSWKAGDGLGNYLWFFRQRLGLRLP